MGAWLGWLIQFQQRCVPEKSSAQRLPSPCTLFLKYQSKSPKGSTCRKKETEKQDWQLLMLAILYMARSLRSTRRWKSVFPRQIKVWTNQSQLKWAADLRRWSRYSLSKTECRARRALELESKSQFWRLGSMLGTPFDLCSSYQNMMMSKVGMNKEIKRGFESFTWCSLFNLHLSMVSATKFE